MRNALIAAAIVALSLPLLAQGGGGRQGGAQGQGGRGSQPPLGPVDALGQAVRRPPPPTGPAPRLPDGTIDLNGVWVGGGAVGDVAGQGGFKGELPLLPAAKKLMEFHMANETQDPHYFCMPMTIPRSTPYPFRFVQNYTHTKPTHMFILHEGNIHSYRQIFMDGRKHPTELDATWFGHSIGSWDKDTLVIDTVGFNDKGWMDHKGTPHTEQLHTIERWTRVNEGNMTNEVTIDDPGAYTRPWSVKFSARLSPPGDEIMEYICQENNQYGIAGGHPNPFAEAPKPQ